MRKQRYLLVGFAVLVFGGAAAARAQDRQGFSLTYDAYVSGVKALTLQFDLAVDDPGGTAVDDGAADYQAAVEIETSGLVSAFVDWRLEATSDGRLADDGAKPTRYRTANFRGDEARSVVIDYGEDGPRDVRSQPAIADEDREAVPVAEIAGTIDPMSALTQALMLAKDGTVCPTFVRIFDGRRRYDLHTEPLGRKVFDGSRVAPYEGPALGCGIRLERIAGFKPFEGREDHAMSSDIEMWMSAVLGDDVWVPVRVVFRGERGLMIVHLKKAELDDGTVVFGDR